jgi:hypothetical protein
MSLFQGLTLLLFPVLAVTSPANNSRQIPPSFVVHFAEKCGRAVFPALWARAVPVR